MKTSRTSWTNSTSRTLLIASRAFYWVKVYKRKKQRKCTDGNSSGSTAPCRSWWACLTLINNRKSPIHLVMVPTFKVLNVKSMFWNSPSLHWVQQNQQVQQNQRVPVNNQNFRVRKKLEFVLFDVLISTLTHPYTVSSWFTLWSLFSNRTLFMDMSLISRSRQPYFSDSKSNNRSDTVVLLLPFLLCCLLGLMFQVCLSLLAFPEVLELQALQQNQPDQLYPKNSSSSTFRCESLLNNL